MGAQGIYNLSEIQGRFRTILLSKLADMLGELGTKGAKSVLDIIGLTEEIQAGVRAKAEVLASIERYQNAKDKPYF